MSFRNRLKIVREEKMYSQVALGAKLGVAQSTIGNWESGTREPNLETVVRIADLFDVSTDYLLGRTDNPHGYIIKAPAELADAHVVSVEKSGSDQLTPEEVAAIRAMLEREGKSDG